MITFPAAMRDAIRSVQCALLNDNEYIVGSVGRFAGPVRQRALDGINATRDLLGCPPSPPIEPPPPPFEGGQCPTLYTVTLDYTVVLGFCGNEITTSELLSSNALGPLSVVTDNSGTAGGGQDLCPGFSYTTIRVDGASGNVGQRGSGFGVRLNGLTVTRNDGLPDDCGDSEPTYPAPINYNTDVDVTYNIDDGTEVTITVPVIYAPITVDFNGNFRIPVTFDFGGNQFSASFPLDVSIPVTINFPGLNPGDGQGVDELPPDAPGTTVPPALPEEKIIGVVVNILSLDERKVSPYSSPGIPRILVPRVASVKFAYSIGAATFWSPDIDVKGDREFIPCPFSQGADLVVASPQIGVELDYVPIRGFPLATKADIPPTT